MRKCLAVIARPVRPRQDTASAFDNQEAGAPDNETLSGIMEIGNDEPSPKLELFTVRGFPCWSVKIRLPEVRVDPVLQSANVVSQPPPTAISGKKISNAEDIFTTKASLSPALLA